MSSKGDGPYVTAASMEKKVPHSHIAREEEEIAWHFWGESVLLGTTPNLCPFVLSASIAASGDQSPRPLPAAGTATKPT
jgi:hypothetical protein